MLNSPHGTAVTDPAFQPCGKRVWQPIVAAVDLQQVLIIRPRRGGAAHD
jgi:hypothetical protein